MAAYRQSGWLRHLCVSALVLLGCLAIMQAATAQTRTLFSLADVPVYVPAPYHPHNLAAVYSSSLYDGQRHTGATSWGDGTHSWH